MLNLQKESDEKVWSETSNEQISIETAILIQEKMMQEPYKNNSLKVQ